MTPAAVLLAAEPVPPRPSKRGNPIAAARVSPEVYDRLYALARTMRVDVSVLIREAIEQRIKTGC